MERSLARLIPAGWTVVGWTAEGDSKTQQTVLKANSYDTVRLEGYAPPSLSKLEESGVGDGDWVGLPDPGAAKDGASLLPLRGPLCQRDGGVFINSGDRQSINNILQTWT